MQMPRLIGLDIGTSSVKGVAIDTDGSVLTIAERGHSLSMPHPGWCEQDPEDWWRSAAAVLDETGIDDAVGIGLSGQMHGLVALDDRDRPVRPAILWNDGRASEECRKIEARLGPEGLLSRTGNRALAGCTAPSLIWVREHEPEVHARIRSILLPKDYVRLRLCGERATDVVDASGTLLFDVSRRAWNDDVLAALELDPAWLPPVHESPEPAGVVNGGAPVAAGAGDEAAAAVSAGVVKEGGPVCIGLGTSGVVVAPLDAYAADPLGRAHAYCHAVPGGWNVLAVMLSAGASLRWLWDVLGRETPLATLMDEAAACEPGADGVRFAPQLAGERMPDPDPRARGAFVGLGLRHERGALTRAVLEGVAFGLRDSLDLVSAIAGRPRTARVCGGGGRSSLWLRIIASALDLPLELTRAQEGAAYGAALLGGVAAGVWEDVHEATAGIAATTVVEPEPRWVERYAELREGHAALRRTLAGLNPG